MVLVVMQGSDEGLEILTWMSVCLDCRAGHKIENGSDPSPESLGMALQLRNMMMKSLLNPVLFALLIAGIAASQEEGEKPAPPDNLNVTAEHKGAAAIAKLRWRDAADNELGFRILRSDNGGEFREVALVGANTTRYDDEVGRYISGSFAYKVQAFNEFGDSEASNMAAIFF